MSLQLLAKLLHQFPLGYSHASLQVGEEFTINQLLDVLLIQSANDAANVLAEKISGSISAFADLMNEKALSIGCKNTHFVNPSGIHDENHYSTAYDLSLIGNYAMKNDVFREIVAKTSCFLPTTDKYAQERTFATTNSLLVQGKYYYPYAIGVKTGFTTPAGNCLVSASLKNNMEWICVVLGATQTDDGISQRYSDTINLLDYANSNYTICTIKNKNEVVYEYTLPNSNQSIKLLAANEVTALIKVDAFDINVVAQINLNDNLEFPISIGQVLGTATYNIDGTSYTVDLIAGNNVSYDSIWSLILKVVMLVILLILIYILLFPPRKKNNFETKCFKIM